MKSQILSTLAALHIDETRFDKFELFAVTAGREAHFAGQVVGLSNERAAELVAGRWERGVVAHIRKFDILAVK